MEARFTRNYFPVLVEPVEHPLDFTDALPADLTDLMDPSFAASEALETLTNKLRLHMQRVQRNRRDSAYWRGTIRNAPSTKLMPPAPERIKVAVNSPRAIAADWETIRAYIYPESAEAAVNEDAQRLRVAAHATHASSLASVSKIQVGTLITVIIDLPAATCRRQQKHYVWRGRWRKTDFGVRYQVERIGEPQQGSVSWFAGMVCIAQLPFQVVLTNDAKEPSGATSHVTAPGYESVFVSYSTKDSAIVDGWKQLTRRWE